MIINFHIQLQEYFIESFSGMTKSRKSFMLINFLLIKFLNSTQLVKTTTAQ